MKRFLLAVLFSTSAFTLNAQPWQMVGPRAMGMGGAGVATAYGADAQYWNPAALKDTDQEMQNVLLSTGLQLETTKDVMNALPSFPATSKFRHPCMKSANGRLFVSTRYASPLSVDQI